MTTPSDAPVTRDVPRTCDEHPNEDCSWRHVPAPLHIRLQWGRK